MKMHCKNRRKKKTFSARWQEAIASQFRRGTLDARLTGVCVRLPPRLGKHRPGMPAKAGGMPVSAGGMPAKAGGMPAKASARYRTAPTELRLPTLQLAPFRTVSERYPVSHQGRNNDDPDRDGNHSTGSPVHTSALP
ncbi:MAG: hypothetical protein OSA98_17310 [Rubripirellula sp.]|nr:hypothetical protein [Rubripirellula sp.]